LRLPRSLTVYVWGAMVDQLLADEHVPAPTSGLHPTAAGTVNWTLADHLGTVRDLVQYSGGTTTNVKHRVFDSYGNLISDTAPTLKESFAYTGRYFDSDAQLQWNLNRWYDPQLGQWVSEDPESFRAGDENLRRYVGNGVLGATDPSGLRTYKLVGYKVSAVISKRTLLGGIDTSGGTVAIQNTKTLVYSRTVNYRAEYAPEQTRWEWICGTPAPKGNIFISGSGTQYGIWHMDQQSQGTDVDTELPVAAPGFKGTIYTIVGVGANGLPDQITYSNNGHPVWNPTKDVDVPATIER
jgi:RHS repeat-associated protein